MIHTAPSDNPATPYLGRTIPDLLDEACANYPNATAFNQPAGDGWSTMSNDTFRTASDEIALGLLDLDLSAGDRVAFFMRSDLHFSLADMGCQIASLINVPIYLSNAIEVSTYVLQHSGSKALIVSDVELLANVADALADVPAITNIVVAEGDATQAERLGLPSGVNVHAMDALRERGRAVLAAHPERPKELREAIDEKSLATIIYTSGTTGRPKGVMLTHENISFNGITAVNSLPEIGNGPQERVLTFLPMTHIFARTLNYVAIAKGHSLFYTSIDDLGDNLKTVKPTMFASVPRVIEKVYDKIMLAGEQLTGLKASLFGWSMGLADQYELGQEPAGFYALQLSLARKLVFSKWQDALGGHIKLIFIGGAALNGTLANRFAAAGVTLIQGYGLTETSPVITNNRINHNRAGAVGHPVVGTEAMIAPDGEILARGPHIMQGYYKNEEATREAIDEDGWFHTGDIGEFTDEGYLRITDRKKSMFKLSTGKYVVPAPIENALVLDALVEQAVVVGVGHKYTTALIFPNIDMVRQALRKKGKPHDLASERLCEHDEVRTLFEEVVERANQHGSHWEQVKRFKLMPELMSIENGLLTPTLKVKRSKVAKAYGTDIDGMYG